MPRNKKKAFIKYTKNGKIIPGSLITTTGGNPPKNGYYKEVETDICCNPSTKKTCIENVLQKLFDQLPFGSTTTELDELLSTEQPIKFTMLDIGFKTTECNCLNCNAKNVSNFNISFTGTIEKSLQYFEALGAHSSDCCVKILSIADTYIKLSESLGTNFPGVSFCCPNIFASIEKYLITTSFLFFERPEIPRCGCPQVFASVETYLKYREAISPINIPLYTNCPCINGFASYETYAKYAEAVGIIPLPPIPGQDYMGFGFPSCSLNPKLETCALSLEPLCSAEDFNRIKDKAIIEQPGKSNTFFSCQAVSNPIFTCSDIDIFLDKGIVNETNYSSQNIGEKIQYLINNGLPSSFIYSSLDYGIIQSNLPDNSKAFYKLDFLYDIFGPSEIVNVVNIILKSTNGLFDNSGLIEYGVEQSEELILYTAIKILNNRPDMNPSLLVEYVRYIMEKGLIFSYGPDCQVSVTTLDYYIAYTEALTCQASQYTDITGVNGDFAWTSIEGYNSTPEWFLDYYTPPSASGLIFEASNFIDTEAISYIAGCYKNDGTHNTDSQGKQYIYSYFTQNPNPVLLPGGYFRVKISDGTATITVYENINGNVTVGPINGYLPPILTQEIVKLFIIVEGYNIQSVTTQIEFGYD